jgi:hypothetical protein
MLGDILPELDRNILLAKLAVIHWNQHYRLEEEGRGGGEESSEDDETTFNKENHLDAMEPSDWNQKS